MDSYTGPWKITGKIKGSSYALEHTDTKNTSKHHAAHISTYPQELLPLFPIDGADNCYGQIYTPIKADPYMNAGVKGFQPSQLFKTTFHATTPAVGSDVRFPTLAEPNDELFEWNENEKEMVFADDSLYVDIEVFATATTPRPPTQAPIAPSVPDIGPQTSSIFASDDKLSFMSHRVPGSAMTEWALARVDFQRSVQAHPAGFQDG